MDLRRESEMKEGEKRKSALKDSASAVPRDRMVQSSSPEAPRTADRRSTTPEKIPEEQKGGKSKGKGQLSKGAKGKASTGKGKGQPWRWRKKNPKGKGKK